MYIYIYIFVSLHIVYTKANTKLYCFNLKNESAGPLLNLYYGRGFKHLQFFQLYKSSVGTYEVMVIPCIHKFLLELPTKRS